MLNMFRREFKTHVRSASPVTPPEFQAEACRAITMITRSNSTQLDAQNQGQGRAHTCPEKWVTRGRNLLPRICGTRAEQGRESQRPRHRKTVPGRRKWTQFLVQFPRPSHVRFARPRSRKTSPRGAENGPNFGPFSGPENWFIFWPHYRPPNRKTRKWTNFLVQKMDQNLVHFLRLLGLFFKVFRKSVFQGF